MLKIPDSDCPIPTKVLYQDLPEKKIDALYIYGSFGGQIGAFR